MCNNCNYEKYFEYAWEILKNPNMSWCHDIVNGIYSWIEENEHITEKQKKAIDRYMDHWED